MTSIKRKIKAPETFEFKVDNMNYIFNFRSLKILKGEKLAFEKELFPKPKMNPFLESDIQEEIITQVIKLKNEDSFMVLTNKKQLLFFDINNNKVELSFKSKDYKNKSLQQLLSHPIFNDKYTTLFLDEPPGKLTGIDLLFQNLTIKILFNKVVKFSKKRDFIIEDIKNEKIKEIEIEFNKKSYEYTRI